MSKEEIKIQSRLLLVLVAREAGLLDGGTQRQWLSILHNSSVR